MSKSIISTSKFNFSYMYLHYYKLTSLLCALVLVLFVSTNSLNAQIKLARELVGAVVTTTTSGSNDTPTQLEVDASAGETMIGYKEGDIILTIGFHQLDEVVTKIAFNNPDDPEVPEPETVIKVTAYPNPTVDNLTVNLGSHSEKFMQLRLISSLGIVLVTEQVDGRESVKFDQLENFPNANYFLQGVDQEGKIYQLATVMIIKQ